MTFQIIMILALVQGITEFLPVSSSGHLLLVHALFQSEAGLEVFKQNLLLDVAVHVGTLFSVLLYFHSDVLQMLCGLKKMVTGNIKNAETKLDLYLLISSLPVIAAGLAISLAGFYWGHNILIVAWMTLIFGIVLWAVDALKPAEKTLSQMNARHALLIGLAQAIALVPGTSRSGITMTMARYLGYSRTEAARYSLLLAIIAIGGAGTLGAIGLYKMGNVTFTLDALLAMALSFVSGYIAIHLMMRWLEKASFKVFAIYRILLGAALLAIGYSLMPL
ncbi:MAG: undecaprenyl-diphosphate phosphatase [Alphaproteobacteria bacterium]|nr:undecaprenyl-diphosphate phosphatase [Alphaproteobacteria bacterium]